MAAASGATAMIFVPETYAPIILSRRAKARRFETENWALHAKIDERQTRISDIVSRYLFRPLQMLIQEPILLLITLYMAFIYGILYLFFESYPISFQQERGWNLGVGALPFLSLTIGVVFGAIFVSYLTQTRFARKMKQQGRVVPEERLPPMILGAVMLPIGLFWFAWTSSPHITWVPQVLAGIPIGMGIFMIFMQGINYIIDCYLMNANSAIAGNTLIRSFAGAGFPLFAVQMYHKLGVGWATSLLGFLAVAFVPVPILFYIYGAKLRKLSKFTPTL
jgi:DHA1 family multidrug resistance protein-like MFS transporter